MLTECLQLSLHESGQIQLSRNKRVFAAIYGVKEAVLMQDVHYYSAGNHFTAQAWCYATGQNMKRTSFDATFDSSDQPQY
jgi:predicted SPOUT superfamily RNA methylase MTH1